MAHDTLNWQVSISNLRNDEFKATNEMLYTSSRTYPSPQLWIRFLVDYNFIDCGWLGHSPSAQWVLHAMPQVLAHCLIPVLIESSF